MSLSTHLATLAPAELAAVLERRPDVLVEPGPRDLSELAAWLNASDSLRAALVELNADELAVARILAITGGRSVADLRADLGPGAEDVIERLAARALVWPAGQRFVLPGSFAESLGIDVARFRRVELIAKEAGAETVRTMVAALGGDPFGTKAQSIERLSALVRDATAVRRAVDRLPIAARRHLDRLLHGRYFMFGGTGGPDDALAAAGLMIEGRYRRPEIPREIAVAVLLDAGAALSGRPEIPPSVDPRDDGRAAAEAAVHAVTGLLDAAADAPLATLKKGGIGARERTRLGKLLGIGEPALMIDVATGLDLLARVAGGFAPTAEFADWRDQPVAQRWTSVARAWLALAWSPTNRETADGEIAPPLFVPSGAGLVRRALLRAAADGGSLAVASDVIGWFCPMHGEDEIGLTRTIAAVLREAHVLGIVAGDRLTTLGERLVAAQDVADLLPETGGTLVLQSDLTAVVAGGTSAAAARVLAAAAAPEGFGAAVTWRFSPDTVRAALDAGWTPAELRGELVAVSARELPQPLDYLIGDVARRHGAVRVRETRCCVTGPEADVSEILHTRSLAKLELHRLAPTVLASSTAPDTLLAALRKAGFAPVQEDADGEIVVGRRPKVQAPAIRRGRERRRIPAIDLATRLLTGGSARADWPTRTRLERLNRRLDAAELTLLADAVDHERTVRIRYRNSVGNGTVRDITPVELWDQWLTAHCHLRRDERDFAVARIETVGPAG